MNTLSAKADSFFEQPAYRWACAQRARSRRGQRPAQNIARGVNVSVQNNSAGAAVDTFLEKFLDDRATPGTLLACPARIYLKQSHPGSFSLGFEYRDELAPASVTDRSGQPIVPEHPQDVQALNRDQAEATHQKIGNLVRMFPTQVGDPRVLLSKLPRCLLAIARSKLLPAHGAPCPSQHWQLGLEKSRVGYVFCVTGRKEVLKPYASYAETGYKAGFRG